MTVVYVDADACPVKNEVLKVAARHALAVCLVANSRMRVEDDPLVRCIVVPEGADAADDWIAEQCGPGDLVVTGDIPLADRCLKRGARVVGHDGRPFTSDNIGAALAMRDLKAGLREVGDLASGGGGGPAFSARDRSRFLQAMENMVQAARREARR